MKAQLKAYEYSYRIHWCADRAGYVATVAEFPAMQSPASVTPHGALDALVDVVADELAALDAAGAPRPLALAFS